MGKALFITEKPSVAKEFSRALKIKGKSLNGYIESQKAVITWCIGHLVTMSYPEKYNPALKKWTLNTLPFLPESYKYEIIGGVKKQFNIVKKLLTRKDISTIYVCTDSGREGEYIYRLVDRLVGVKGKEKKRVWINSQTNDEILRGVREAIPLSDYDSLKDSAYLRAIEDYAAGINFSRLLTLIYSPILSKVVQKKSVVIAVGRVMSCVLGMIVGREREIRNFTKTPFYKLKGDFTTEDGLDYSGEWKSSEEYYQKNSGIMFNEKGFLKKEDAEELAAKLREFSNNNPPVIEEVKRKKERKNPPLLYNLAELQNECSRLFKINPDETLKIAQKLYEQKLVTYPRTDARVLSTAVFKEIDRNIKGLSSCRMIRDIPAAALKILEESWIGKLNKKRYVNDTKITDHYAIIPTGQGFNNYSSLSQLEEKVYSLISRRFLAIFFPSAVYSKINVITIVQQERFYTSEKLLVDPGYQEILHIGKKNDPVPKCSDALEKLKKGSKVHLEDLELKEGETKPPRRYTSGSIILAMENAGKLIEDDELREQIKGSGIGTSATRAEIIKKLHRIKYIRINKKTQVLTPANLGELIYEVLKDSIKDMLDPRLTASWEKGLKMVANKETTAGVYRTKLENYIRRKTREVLSKKDFLTIQKKISDIPMDRKKKSDRKKSPDFVVGICPACGRGEVLVNSKGYGCNKWKEGCKFFIGNICGIDIPRPQVELLLTEGKTSLITGFRAKNGNVFDACLQFINGRVKFLFIDEMLKDIKIDS